MKKGFFYRVCYYVNIRGEKWIRESRKKYSSASEVLKNLPKYKEVGGFKRYLEIEPFAPLDWYTKNIIEKLEDLAKWEEGEEDYYYTYTTPCDLFIDLNNIKKEQFEEIKKRVKEDHSIIIQSYIDEEGNKQMQLDYKSIADLVG